MNSTAGEFSPFDAENKKRVDKVKIISLVVNALFVCFIIGLIIGISLKRKTKIIRSTSSRSPVSNEQLIPIRGRYYPSGISGPAALQGKSDLIDSKYYTMNDFYHMKSNSSLHILHNFRTYQQTSEYTCGCGCVLMAIDYVGKHDDRLNESYCAELADIGTDIHTSAEGTNGAYPYNLIKVLQHYDYEVSSNNGTAYFPFEDYHSFRNWLINSIDNGWPVIVLSNDWSGHYTVLIGIDTMGTDDTYDDVIIMADPYDTTDHRQDGYNVWGLERFYDLWGVPCSLLKNIETRYQYIQVKSKH